MLPDDIKNDLEKVFLENDNRTRTIFDVRSLSGGSINKAFEITLDDGQKYFLKYNLETLYPKMFDTEAKGLKLLHSTNLINTPEVYHIGYVGQYSYLLLQMIIAGSISKSFFKNLGRNLAQLHQKTNPTFGLDYQNYIGNIPQLNNPDNNFSSFFINMRLRPLVQKASHAGLLPNDIAERFEKFYIKIENLIPREPPSLLHGDLWNGNRIIGPNGDACLIDPAVYYGHRETDIAMTMLFRGFDTDFYKSYNETHPLELGWKERIEIHNLYPLLVHLNLFGSEYLIKIMQIINKYT